MTPTTALRLTGEELTALAHCLDTPWFPEVDATAYDGIDATLHPLLDGAFLATLTGRGLLTLDAAGDLWPSGPLLRVLSAVTVNRVHVGVDQTRPATNPGTTWRCSVLAGKHGLLRHRTRGPWHDFEHDPDVTDLGVRLRALLGTLVDRSSGPGRAGRRRRRGEWSTIAGALDPPATGWLRTTVLVRSDDTGDDTRVDGFVGVFDGGPGELWLVHEDEPGSGAARGDAAVVAEPVSAADLDAALRAFTSVDIGIRRT